jgi:hypothetical protein
MIKSLDSKVSDILANPSSSSAFIIADAKDADMAFGAAAPGPSSIPKASETPATGRPWKTSGNKSAKLFDRESSISC